MIDMRRLLSLLGLALLAISVWAQQISEQQAKDRVLQFFNNSTQGNARGLAARSLQLDAAEVEVQSIYAFNVVGGGYVIASGDSRALPVLGYSDSGSIDWADLPDNMRAWLKSYDKAMKTLGKHTDFVDGICKRDKAMTRAAKAAIAPLVKTNWDQEEPYWNECPLYDGADPNLLGERCYTGCVATAMAQVMNYHQWPKTACQEIPAYDTKTAYQNQEKVWHLDALPSTTFDWDNMLNTYEDRRQIIGTAVQQQAVATLMRYCGQSVYMNYSPEFSGSDHQQVAEALIKYFGYDPAIHVAYRVWYNIDEWENLIYDELAEGRPVQYGGSSEDSGHSFVCDGYDGGGLFHMNWGWGSTSDGYFSLSVVNPYNNTSAGSGLGGIGYCMSQDAVVGVKPAAEGSVITAILPAIRADEQEPLGVIAADSVYFKYLFETYTYDDVHIDYAFGTCDEDGTLTPLFIGDDSDSYVYNSSYNVHYVKIDSTSTVFENGKALQLVPMVRLRTIPGCDWQLVSAAFNHVVAGRMDNGQFFLYKEVPDLVVKKAEVTKGLGRMGMRNDVTLTVENRSDFDCSMPLALVPSYYGKVAADEITEDTPASEGDPLWCGAYIRAGETAEVTYCLEPLNCGSVGVALFTPDGYSYGEAIVSIQDTYGSYNDFVINESDITVEDVYTGDYQTEDYLEGDELRPGHYVYNVCLSDNPETTIPDGKPADNVLLYAAISDVYKHNESKIYYEKNEELKAYLSGLYSKGGDGSYKLTYELPIDIKRGGYYYIWSYIIEFLDDKNKEYIQSCYQYEEFPVYDDPSIRVKGDTIVGSGQQIILEIELNTGYPYDLAAFTGNEQGHYTLYSLADDGTMTESGSYNWDLGFVNGLEYLAASTTMKLESKLPDGHYVVHISSDWEPLGTRDINLYVGETTSLGKVVREVPEDTYTDLQGRRLDRRPTRKGIYIKDGRKVVVK